MSRRFELPVYLSRGTLENLPSQVGQFAHYELFQSGSAFQIGDLRIQPFATSHDAREPSGFVIEHEGVRLGICTDLGVVTHLVRTRLQGCHGLILEANHDISLLLHGPYPLHLKQRIRSRHGHLSNEDTCELLKSLHHEALRTVTFAHLSETNNDPRLVEESARCLCEDAAWETVHFAIGRQQEICEPEELP